MEKIKEAGSVVEIEAVKKRACGEGPEAGTVGSVLVRRNT